MAGRLSRLWRSILGLPAWVKIWVIILASTNMASFAFLHTQTGRWTAIAFVIVGCFNMPMMFIQGGLTRLLSMPHFVWAPLLVYIYPRVFGAHALDWSSPEHTFALAVFTANGISLMFDALETFRWLSGRREILGLAHAE